MQLNIINKLFDNPPLFDRGGEALIYELDSTNLAKIYFECDDARRQKVLALCDFYDNFSARFSDRLIAFPEHPAYENEISFDTLVGFSMGKYKLPKLSSLGYNIKVGRFREKDGFSFSDLSALRAVYHLFSVLDELHQTRVVLGDVNPRNIMWDSAAAQAAIVDVDAAQVGGYPCWSTHPDYNDPRLEQRGATSSGLFMFDFGSDVFALAAVCYEFLVGAKPHAIHVAPPPGLRKMKMMGISEIRCLESGRSYLGKLGVSYFDCAANDAIRKRLEELKSQDRGLYNFFVSIFVSNERENLLYSLPITDSRHPAYYFFHQRPARTGQPRKKSALHSTGPVEVPDMVIDPYISAIVSSRTNASAQRKKLQRPRADPVAFDAFLRQFGLTA